MINENIRVFRNKKGLSQQEMADRLHVVRQTVSKWEKGLSVPDAQMLVQISELLGVSVNRLLDIQEKEISYISLLEELERINYLLTEKNKKEKLVIKAYKKRSIIVFLSFISLIFALIFQNEIISVFLIGLCMLISLCILYRNLELLTLVTTEDTKIGILRITTIFNMVVFLICILVSVLISIDVIRLSEGQEKFFAMTIVSCVMLFSGIVSPRLPFTRHTGLRLPWTVQDEDTWNLAHRIIGYIAFPIVIMYVAATYSFDNFEIITLFTIIAWIGIPGLLSLVFFWKKMTGKL